MGTQVHYKSYLAGHNPMRDLSGDSNGNGWPLYYEDKNLANGQYYAGFMPQTIADAYPGCDKNALKQKMLEHEEIFKNQVNELHRLYRIQRDMMEEIKRKELVRHRTSNEPSSSSSLQGSQAPSEGARKWHVPGYPLMNSGYARSTVSGADITNSPLSYTKGNNILPSRVPSQNGCTKDFEASEPRPSKVRKKLFDLELPADEYIDPDDTEQPDNNVSGSSNFVAYQEYSIASESSRKLSIGGVASVKTGPPEAFTSFSNLRSSIGLADLNEPVEVEEATGSSSNNIFGNSTSNGAIKGIDLSAKPNSGYLGLHKEVLQMSHHGSHTVPVINLSAENKIRERERLPHAYEAGHGRGNLSSVSRGVQQDKLSFPTSRAQVMLNLAHPPGTHLIDHSKEDLWKERAGCRLEASDRNRDDTNKSLEPVVVSQDRSSYPLVGSSDVTNTWPQFMSSWGKPVNGFTQKLGSFDSHPSLISSSSSNKSLRQSAQNQEILGDKWHVNDGSRLNPALRSDPPSRNGFIHGCSSGSKDLPVCFSSVGFDNLNGSRSDNIASEHLVNHGTEKAPKGSSYMEMKPLRDMNLNVAFPKILLNETIPQQDLEIIDGKGKPEEHQSLLPWLRAKPTLKNEVTNSRRDVNHVNTCIPRASPYPLFGKTDMVSDLNQTFDAVSASKEDDTSPQNETNEMHSVKKILGFPIFEKCSTSENNASSLTKREGKNLLIDINVACDASLFVSDKAPAVEELVVAKPATRVRNFIDLNSCITEDEDPPPAPAASKTAGTKTLVEIDLEAPAVAEEEEDVMPMEEHEQETTMQPRDCISEKAEEEATRSAAEAIVAISSSCQHLNQESGTCPQSDASLPDTLLWFADVISSGADQLKNKSIKECSSKEMDDFEATTLQLPETKEEDYMPKPFVPEVQKVEEAGTNPVSTRTRRGQARRGRQRRDFQRDILPGLASLSRHEVTEDLQTFGGLMKAMGHVWNAGLTRRNGTRNGGARGRGRTVAGATPTPTPTSTPTAAGTPLVQQLNNAEPGLEARSLTGWGKTTRRPRRQRCSAGNPPSVPLT